MSSIFMVDCTLYHDSTSVDCEGFTVYTIPHCDPYCWTIWLVCSAITCTVWFCLLNTKMLLRLRPARNKKIFKMYHQKALLLVSQHNYRFRGPLWCINHGQQQKREDLRRMFRGGLQTVDIVSVISIESYISAFRGKRLSSHFQRSLLFNSVCFCLGQSLQVFSRYKSGRLQVLHCGAWYNKASDHSRPHVNDYKCFPVSKLSSVFLAEAFSRR